MFPLVCFLQTTSLMSKLNACKAPEDVLQRVRQAFVANREKLIATSLPWTPWALVKLLDINDKNSKIPAEFILYQALQHSRARGGIETCDAIVQEKFIAFPERKGDVYFRDSTTPIAGKYTKYMMEHAGSRGKITCEQMWDFVVSIHPNDLGLIARYKKTKSLSVRMKKLTKRVSKHYPHILYRLDGLSKLFVCVVSF